MEERNKDIEKEIDLTLESLDGINSAKANPSLYEKIINRMETRKRANYNPKLKYALIITLLVLINLFTFIYFSNGSNEATAGSDEIKDTFKNEYSLTISTYNY